MSQTLILKRLSYPNTKYLVCSHLSIEGDPHLSEKERSDFSLPSTGCAESHPSGTEGGFSEQDIHVIPNLTCWYRSMTGGQRPPKWLWNLPQMVSHSLQRCTKRGSNHWQSKCKLIACSPVRRDIKRACYAWWRKEDLANLQHFWRTDEEEYLICKAKNADTNEYFKESN